MIFEIKQPKKQDPEHTYLVFDTWHQDVFNILELLENCYPNMMARIVNFSGYENCIALKN